MKTLDGIKKLNAVKKADGELLIEAIDLKELKGAKERDLAEAFLTAIEGIPEKDEQFIPEELAELYNKLAEETAPEPEAEKEVAKPAKAAKKSEVKATAKPAAKSAKEPDAKPETAKKETAKTDSKKPAAKAETKKAGVGVSCYGHKLGSSGALMDEAIKAGNSLEKIAKSCGVSLQRVKGHICHLAKEHNVKVKV
jgi:chemotaxis protein histidine kinase CheA